ncbi:MAG TPA: hypothetical protein PKY25_01625 [Bacilli bacterium]|nr:hypothetical protein [Bacilli bacterium]
MKKKIILILIVVILIASYFGYKVYILDKYKTELKIQDIYKSEGTNIQIKTNKNIVNNFKEEDISFIIPNGFNKALDLEDSETLYLEPKIESDIITEYKAAFYFGKSPSNYSNLVYLGAGGKISTKDIKKLFKKYNINNEIDLQKYGMKVRKEKINIFSSTSRIKMEYIFGTYMPISDKLMLIQGDIKGYLISFKDEKKQILYVANIEYNNYIYAFWFKNGTEDYFSVEKIRQFLNNVEFE